MANKLVSLLPNGPDTENVSAINPFGVILCQIESLQRNIHPFCTPTLGISTKQTPLCPSASPPSNKPDSVSLAPLLLELAYFAVLCILHLACTDGNIVGQTNKLHAQISQDCK